MKMKIKIFRNNNAETISDMVNEFISDKQVIDIKYRSEFVSVEFKDRVPVRGAFYESILVMYEEKNNNN